MQVNGNINTADFLQVGNQATKASSNSKESSDLDFASFLATPQKNTDNILSEKKISRKTDYKNRSSEDTVTQKNDKAKAIRMKKNTMKQMKKEEDVVDEQPEEVSTELEKKAIEILSSLLQLFTFRFQVSEEELQGKMEEFGMKFSDLLSTDGIKDFFLNMQSADVSDLIVNEDMNIVLQDLLTEFQNVLLENGVEEVNLQNVISEEDILSFFEDVAETKTDAYISEKSFKTDFSEQKAEPEVIINEQMGFQNTDVKSKTASNDADGQKGELPDERQKNAGKRTFTNPILQSIQDAIDQVDTTAISEQSVRETDILNQVVEQVRVNMNRTTTSLELQLYPEHLGKIQINVVSKDGIMTARIVAETEAVKKAIEDGLTNLKEVMEEQDLKVEAIEVMVATTGFESGDEEQKSFEQENPSKGKHKLVLSEVEEEAEEEDAEAEKMRQIGSSVSYTA